MTYPYKRLHILVETYWDIQKVRIALENRLRSRKSTDLELAYFADEFNRLEKRVVKDLKKEVSEHPLWSYWLKSVVGIGEIFTAQLIHLISGKKHTEECKKRRQKYFAKKKLGEPKRKPFNCDCPEMEIERFRTVSALVHYAGLHVVHVCSRCGHIHKTGKNPGICDKCGGKVVGKAPRRRRGQKVDWNTKLKALCWRIGKSFVKKKESQYRKPYEKFRREEDEKHPELTKRHRDARARRKTVKLFLAHLFDKWYRLRGLEPPKPYPIGVLGHANEIKPPSAKRKNIKT